MSAIPEYMQRFGFLIDVRKHYANFLSKQPICELCEEKATKYVTGQGLVYVCDKHAAVMKLADEYLLVSNCPPPNLVGEKDWYHSQ